MELTGLDLIDLALSYAKELELKQCFEKLKKAELEMMKQDAVTRREKSTALIKYIHAVDVETTKIKMSFAKYSSNCSEEEKEVYDRVLKLFAAQRKQAVTEKQSLS